MQHLCATTKYGDFKGSVAADNRDTHNIEQELRDRGLIQEGEQLIAVELVMGENHGSAVNEVGLVAYLGDALALRAMPEDEPLPLRIVDIDLTPAEFLGFFKRFNCMLTRIDGLHGRAIQVSGGY